MRVEIPSCKRTTDCFSRPSIPLEVAKSVNVTKTNTLHQFDTASIVGVPSPVGKVPIVFYVRESCTSTKRGIIFCGDRDTVCFLYPETAHAEWCQNVYDLKYDHLEHYDNGVESGYERKWGILELWHAVCRKWYNGQVMYRPDYRIQGCGRDLDGYPTVSDPEVVEEKPVRRKTIKPVSKSNLSPCGCGSK